MERGSIHGTMPSRKRPRYNPAPPLYLRDDSGCWWTYFYVRGKRVRLSTRCTDRKAAELEAARLQREATDARQRAQTVSDTLLAYIDERTDWSPASLKRNARSAVSLDARLGKMLTTELTRKVLEDYVSTRAENVTVSVGVELELLFAALKAARRRGEPVPDLEMLRPARKRPENDQRTRWLTRQEVMTLTQALPGDRSEWVWLACYTGCRLNELNTLTWEHFDLAAGLLRVPGTKTKHSKRTIPLAASVLELLAYRRKKGQPPVTPWQSPHGTLKNVTDRLGLAPVRPHDFRRTFASWLLQANVSHHAIADLLGHAGLKLVRSVYAHLGPSELREAIRRLP